MIMSKDNGCSETCEVLVVDDDPDVLDLLLAHLTTRGIRTRVLTSGKDLVEHITLARPRLVFLDVSLPDFNGYALCDAIKNDPSTMSTPIYFLSALPPDDLVWHVGKCGASGFIPKPFTLGEIDAVLATLGIWNAPDAT